MGENKTLEQETHFFFGIYHGKLFIQIVDHNDVIAYEEKVLLPENYRSEDIKDATPKLFVKYNDRDKKIIVSKNAHYEIDGLKLRKSGNSYTDFCQSVGVLYPEFMVKVFSYLFWSEK